MKAYTNAIALGTIGLTAAVTGCHTATAQETSKTAKKPNVIYILADDLGYAEVGCYGQTKIKTPNIDRIAREGMKFTDHYSGSAVCAPSRCVLLTGLHTGHAQIRQNGRDPKKNEGQRPLVKDTVTIGTLMQDAGYKTGAIGKWGLGGPGDSGDPDKQGFDFFYGNLCQAQAHNFYPEFIYRNTTREILKNKGVPAHAKFPKNEDKMDPANYSKYQGVEHAHDLCTNEAIKFIKDNKEKPFFLYLPYAIPHASLQITDDSLAEYLPLGWDTEPYLGDNGYLPHRYPRACYAAMVTRMDRDIGRIMDLVKELGLDDNTLIVFTSDNGPTFNGGTDSAFFNSAGPLKGLKCSLNEGGIRVPMVVRWPGKIKPGTVTNHVSAFQDIMPTLTDIIGQATPQGIDGISILPTLLGKGDDQKNHDYLYWEISGQQTIRMGDWKAYRHAQKPDAIELYNLKEDIGQKNDVAKLHPEKVTQLKKVFTSARTESKNWPLMRKPKVKGKKKGAKKSKKH